MVNPWCPPSTAVCNTVMQNKQNLPCGQVYSSSCQAGYLTWAVQILLCSLCFVLYCTGRIIQFTPSCISFVLLLVVVYHLCEYDCNCNCDHTCALGFGSVGGINGRQSWVEDDILVSLSTPGPTHDMVLGVVGLLVVGIATYSPRSLLHWAISVVVSALCQALYMQLLLQWPQR